jgi:hypothetical protein
MAVPEDVVEGEEGLTKDDAEKCEGDDCKNDKSKSGSGENASDNLVKEISEKLNQK